MKRKIDDILTEEMPIERLFLYGEENLSIAELIAILLRTGSKNSDVLSLSRKLISDYGNVRELVNASSSELMDYEGIGKNKAATLRAAFELSRRINSYNKDKKVAFTSANDIFNYVKNDMRFGNREYFLVIALNSKLEVIDTEVISVGTLTQALVNPREVFSFALKKKAHRLVVCHNHPSGHVTPSKNDFALTDRLISAGRIIGVEVIDHIIISNNDYYSMKQNADI